MSTLQSALERSIYSISASEAQEAAQAYRAVRGEITRIEDGDNSTKSLISSAKEIIKEFSARPDSDRVFTYGKGESVEEERPSLRLDKVLSAMLTYSRTCGGDEGQRYVASAIMACREKEGGEMTATESKRLTVWELVRAVAITWVTHFLFVLRANEDHSSPAGITLDACLILRWPAPDPNFEGKPGTDMYESAALSFEILRSFTRIAAQTREELEKLIFTPENALTFEIRVFRAFNQFKFCMLATERSNEYSLKIYESWPTEGVPRQPKNGMIIVLEDHTRRTAPETQPIPLPSPHLIAIHAAVAEILEESGARAFLNRLLSLYSMERADGTLCNLRYWAKLEFMRKLTDDYHAWVLGMIFNEQGVVIA